MEKHPLVSIIALNYNQTEVTCEFLHSLYGLTYPNFEVIVVDNASKENPQKKIEEVYPDLKFIRSDENLGYAGGNNLGIKEAKGAFYFIVNNDTEVTPDLLDNLIAPFFREDNIAIVCPKIKYYHHPELIQYAGFTQMNPFTGRNKTIGEKELDFGQTVSLQSGAVFLFNI
jgi:GT2 family glycosyltransferase